MITQLGPEKKNRMWARFRRVEMRHACRKDILSPIGGKDYA